MRRAEFGSNSSRTWKTTTLQRKTSWVLHDTPALPSPPPPHRVRSFVSLSCSSPPRVLFGNDMSPSPKAKSPPLKASSKITWRPTKIMNMRDLSKDDDFLSHLLVEKLGTCNVPLLVHKMDPTRRLPKTDARLLLGIVRRVSTSFLLFISPSVENQPADAPSSQMTGSLWSLGCQRNTRISKPSMNY